MNSVVTIQNLGEACLGQWGLSLAIPFKASFNSVVWNGKIKVSVSIWDNFTPFI